MKSGQKGSAHSDKQMAQDKTASYAKVVQGTAQVVSIKTADGPSIALEPNRCSQRPTRPEHDFSTLGNSKG